MLNALIQLSTLVYGLAINFLAPMVYGLTAYGEFIAENAVVFLIHRAMSIISEPLIRFTRPNLLLANSLVLNGVVFALFAVVNQWASLGSSLLLGGILLSVSVLLSMQALRLRRSYIAFLIIVSLCFVGLMLWSVSHGQVLSLVRVMEISAWAPSVVCVLYLFTRGATLPSLRELKTTLVDVLRHVPRIITITSAMNMLTSALPVFLAPILPARDLGLFKVMTSVIQAATSVFPVSTQAVLASFVQHPRGVEFYRLLSSLAMLYFAAACMGLVACALVLPVLVPYVALAACLPAYYHAILTERHLTATGHIRTLVMINLAVVAVACVALLWVDTLAGAVLIYTGGFTLYGLALSMADRDIPPYLPMLGVVALCPLAIHLMQQQVWIGLFYGALVMLVTLLQHRPTRDDVLLLWREL